MYERFKGWSEKWFKIVVDGRLELNSAQHLASDYSGYNKCSSSKVWAKTDDYASMAGLKPTLRKAATLLGKRKFIISHRPCESSNNVKTRCTNKWDSWKRVGKG
jgi:hypothetical protein